jgi:type I restriction enzyme, S subunit
MAWRSVPFPETVRKISVGRQNQIPASEIKAGGRFPVIDQGQSFIAGYSDDESRLITRDLPVIVFGDHTRVVKFVDFPFILGADGTKVLKPREDDFDARFFAFALQSLNLPNRGYNRHFTLLKERKLFRPELAEQHRIAGVLELVQRAIAQQERHLSLTAELQKALLHQLFTHGLRNEPQKQTELGPIPQSWDLRSIEELELDIGDGNYSTKYPKQEQFFSAGVPFLRANNIVKGQLVWDDMRYISPELHAELKKGHTKKGDVCLVTRGNIGEVAFVTDEFVNSNMNAQLVRLNGGGLLDGKFLYFALSHPITQTQFRSLKTGTALQQLPIGKLKFVQIPIPSRDEQLEIASSLWLITEKAKLIDRKRAALDSLFRTLLHKLMTAQIRVHDVDLTDLHPQ